MIKMKEFPMMTYRVVCDGGQKREDVGNVADFNNWKS
jgi:hypothetical protein